jgi:hypothetical protein
MFINFSFAHFLQIYIASYCPHLPRILFITAFLIRYQCTIFDHYFYKYAIIMYILKQTVFFYCFASFMTDTRTISQMLILTKELKWKSIKITNIFDLKHHKNCRSLCLPTQKREIKSVKDFLRFKRFNLVLLHSGNEQRSIFLFQGSSDQGS